MQTFTDSYIDRICADVNDGSTRLDPVAPHELGLAGGGYDDVGLAHYLLRVLRL